ncbi:MAG TPA: osmotically inducible protein OsmC [Desulfosporosinus sp.]|nr:osmotically inducible protein OsmC [Desulfosporosinus sp.]
MSQQLTASAEMVNQKVKFIGTSGSNPEVTLDYTPPIGDGEGYTSLELFLVSLASCAGTAIASLLRKMRKDVSGLKINVKGNRKEQPPTGFEKIHMEIILKSKDALESDVKKAISLSEESICPVWNMIKHNVEISSEYEIVRV